MIPICRDPKRFVAALNKFRAQKLSKNLPYRGLPLPLTANAQYSARSLSGIRELSNGEHGMRSAAFSTAPKLDSELHTHQPAAAESIESIRRSSSSASSLQLVGRRGADWWTGKAPVAGLCPGVASDGKLYSLPQVTVTPGKATRESIQAYFDNTWTLTEVLFSALQGEAAFVRPPYHDLRHPMIFYYGHPAALYVNKLRVAGLVEQPINAYFESVFETGVDEMSWDDLSKNKMAWPTVAEVHAYRKTVYQTVSRIIGNISDADLQSIDQNSKYWSLLMGFEHERIHLETSSFLINELPKQYVQFPAGFPSYHPSVPAASARVVDPVVGKHYPQNEMIEVGARAVTIGKPRSFPSFGWDNEYGERTINVPAFRASKFKVSNGEFMEFVKDAGYARNELWTETGWKWRAFRNVKWPTFWQRSGPQGRHEYDLRVIFDTVPMPWDWPVCVNYHEAVAFANWKSLKTGRKYRILTEPEHRAIRDLDNPRDVVEQDYITQQGGHALKEHGGPYNTNLAYASMSPVNGQPANRRGFHDVFGNAWEWTEDYFSALPGFQVHPYYEDFSTPCFDGLHQVIMGGSFISTGNEASEHARFHFRPHFFQHASFRVVEQVDAHESMVTSDTDAPGPFVGDYPFRRSAAQLAAVLQAREKDSHEHSMSQLLAKHFGHQFSVAQKLWPNHTLQQVPRLIEDFFRQQKRDMRDLRVIEVGCGVGGVSFELARNVHTVLGFDHHAEAVHVAKQLWQDRRTTVGENTATLPAAMTAQQVEFRVSDPMCLPAEVQGFDLVVLHDTLAKVSSPNAVLGRLGGVRGLVKPGGVLVVLDSFQWSEDRTPKSLWLGSAPQSSEDTLVQRLAEQDIVLAQPASPLSVFWQDTQRKFRGQEYSFLVFTRRA